MLGGFIFQLNWPKGRVFGVLNLLTSIALHNLLNTFHLRERDKMLLRAILCVRVWNGFLLGEAMKEEVPCRFFGGRDGDGQLFWDSTFPPCTSC